MLLPRQVGVYVRICTYHGRVDRLFVFTWRRARSDSVILEVARGASLGVRTTKASYIGVYLSTVPYVNSNDRAEDSERSMTTFIFNILVKDTERQIGPTGWGCSRKQIIKTTLERPAADAAIGPYMFAGWRIYILRYVKGTNAGYTRPGEGTAKWPCQSADRIDEVIVCTTTRGVVALDLIRIK